MYRGKEWKISKIKEAGGAYLVVPMGCPNDFIAQSRQAVCSCFGKEARADATLIAKLLNQHKPGTKGGKW